MKIAIHQREGTYSDGWIQYCDKQEIPYKLVDCYQTDIIEALKDCDALMWHFSQAIPQDLIFAKQLLFTMESAGKFVFPDFHTMWHFDDKIGQKYLLESIGAPLVPSYVFYSKTDALRWINETTFPKVFKLRGGASSENVKLVRTKEDAKKFVKRAFGKGFRQFNSFFYLKESIRKYKLGESSVLDIIKKVARLFNKLELDKFSQREKGYVYFQDFIANNDSDIRLVVVDNKAFGEKRFVRKNDFRASGSHMRQYDKEIISEATLRISFEIAKKLNLQCVAFDYVYENGNPLIVEISFGTTPAAYKPCPGYWDSELNFHEGEFDFCAWMVEELVDKINNKNTGNHTTDSISSTL
jgi:glutathione synthase/RimK-type ligase-like ATP-grasp enzyme